MGARRATTAGVYGRVQTGIHGAYDAMQVLPTQRTCMCRVRRYLRGPHDAMPTVRSERAMPEMFRARKNSYRARKIAAEIAGPVPPEVYRKLLAEGPCVYCGAPADHIDHVRPLLSRRLGARVEPGSRVRPMQFQQGAQVANRMEHKARRVRSPALAKGGGRAGTPDGPVNAYAG
jgi:hypothetical protein